MFSSSLMTYRSAASTLNVLARRNRPVESWKVVSVGDMKTKFN